MLDGIFLSKSHYKLHLKMRTIRCWGLGVVVMEDFAYTNMHPPTSKKKITKYCQHIFALIRYIRLCFKINKFMLNIFISVVPVKARKKFTIPIFPPYLLQPAKRSYLKSNMHHLMFLFSTRDPMTSCNRESPQKHDSFFMESSF